MADVKAEIEKAKFELDHVECKKLVVDGEVVYHCTIQTFDERHNPDYDWLSAAKERLRGE